MGAEESDDRRMDTILLEEWKTVVSTQMHFNEMLMQMRMAAVTIVIGFLGAAAYSLQYDELYLSSLCCPFHASALIVVAGLAMLIGIFLLDRYYYFKMLLGSVERGYQLDDDFSKRYGSGRILGMTTTIRDKVGDKKNSSSTSLWLLNIYYILIAVILLISLACILLGYDPPSD